MLRTHVILRLLRVFGRVWFAAPDTVSADSGKSAESGDEFQNFKHVFIYDDVKKKNSCLNCCQVPPTCAFPAFRIAENGPRKMRKKIAEEVGGANSRKKSGRIAEERGRKNAEVRRKKI